MSEDTKRVFNRTRGLMTALAQQLPEQLILDDDLSRHISSRPDILGELLQVVFGYSKRGSLALPVDRDFIYPLEQGIPNNLFDEPGYIALSQLRFIQVPGGACIETFSRIALSNTGNEPGLRHCGQRIGEALLSAQDFIPGAWKQHMNLLFMGTRWTRDTIPGPSCVFSLHSAKPEHPWLNGFIGINQLIRSDPWHMVCYKP